MAKEISLNKTYKSTDEFKKTLKDALLIHPNGVLRIGVWYDHARSPYYPIISVVMQPKPSAIETGGVTIYGVDDRLIEEKIADLLCEAVEELKDKGIYVHPTIYRTWRS